ncbi:Exo-poly-alpha-D-galacturonosidase [Phytophthora palmivora]|uniref:Exo-poly-alpha-D-galacturonosidase n=1 Tax=Phytophthora palmivora TaxID=4796 RepID=A0A2P4YJI8_9STRA|nr:Exo-poly-alpha-D-galacturonosidase [Phytophthora palmivora]
MVTERFRPGGTLEGTQSSMIVNMDEMTVHYEQTAATAITPTNSKAVAIRGNGYWTSLKSSYTTGIWKTADELGTDLSVSTGGYACVL